MTFSTMCRCANCRRLFVAHEGDRCTVCTATQAEIDWERFAWAAVFLVAGIVGMMW